MAIFKCKMCGGTLEITGNETVVTCEYCGTRQTLPRLDDDKRANLYDRANHFRRSNDYDKAADIYEQILSEDHTDAEAYWSLVLCRYGIEYVEDPATHRRIPTVNRMQFTSILADEDYKSALQYADAYQREVYEQEAKAIDEIQKGILAISQREEPFDVFLCYKETDDSGRRTQDSVLANDLYHQLTQEGFKVFFSRITLEDKLGTAYEPYIFAALNSAKVMVVLGTKPEYFNAVWVRNEWSRYLALIRGGAEKVLIPAYRDMDPYDLPEEFSHLQAQDMSKLGFMQDLIRGIKKIVQAEEPKTGTRQEPAASENTSPLLKRTFMFLEDGNWQEADEYCERVLDREPENAEAYLGKLMAELQVRRREELKDREKTFDGSSNYQKAIKFGDPALVKELQNDTAAILYRQAERAMQAADTEEQYRDAAAAFEILAGYEDAEKKAQECLRLAEESHNDSTYDEASKLLAEAEINSIDKCEQARTLFQSIPGWRDADEKADACQQKIEELRVAELQQKKELESHKKKVCRIGAFVAIAGVIALAVGLVAVKVIMPFSLSKRAAGYRENISSTLHTVGLKEDGTVVACGDNDDGQCDVSDWSNIVAISAGTAHTVGLKANGTVVACGDNGDGQCDVSGWSDIVAVSAGDSHTVGLKEDGTVAACGDNDYGQCDVSDWSNIVAISAGTAHTVGLKANGTVVAVGATDSRFIVDFDQCDVSSWSDIVAISAGVVHTVGLKSDGTVIACGSDEGDWSLDFRVDYGQCDVSSWSDIVAISAGYVHTVGLKSDGTVVACGMNDCGQCDVSGWSDIVAISAGARHTVGLKADGTVVSCGYNDLGQRDVSGWSDIKVPDRS